MPTTGDWRACTALTRTSRPRFDIATTSIWPASTTAPATWLRPWCCSPGQARPGDKDLRSFEWHYLWALTNHDTFREFKAEAEVYQVALSPAGDRLAAVSKDHRLYLLDAHTLARQAVIDASETEVNGVAWSPDGSLLATADDHGRIRLWNAKSHPPVRDWKAHDVKAYNVAFFAGGSQLATCGDEPVIRLWDATSGEPAGVLEGHSGTVEAIVYSPVNELFASAGTDGQAIVWDLTKRKPLKRFIGHQGKLTSLAFSPDGEWLATGGHDCAVRLYRLSSGRCRSHGYHLDIVQSVAFTQTAGCWRAIAAGRFAPITSVRISPKALENSGAGRRQLACPRGQDLVAGRIS